VFKQVSRYESLDLDGLEELYCNVISWARVMVSANTKLKVCKWREKETHIGCEQIGGKIRFEVWYKH